MAHHGVMPISLPGPMLVRSLGPAALGLALLTGCGGEPAGSTSASPASSAAGSGAADADAGQRFPDVQEVQLTATGPGTYDVAVTISSPYDTPERYADGWRVTTPDGDVLGEHTLTHDHAAEQPFTRTQPGLAVPDGVQQVTVEGRDSANGFGGTTVTVDVPR